jgi:hypothetical protein
LCNLFREEFLSKYKTPISSDAFSSFGIDSKMIHDKEATKATKYLVNNVIEEFVKKTEIEKSILYFNGEQLTNAIRNFLELFFPQFFFYFFLFKR